MSPRRRKEDKIAGLDKLNELDPELARKLNELVQSKELLNNRYRNLAFIDKGGFGLVFTAEDINVGRTVAIKVLRKKNSEQQRRQFRAEATILGNLQHSVLPVMFEQFTEGDLRFIVMEYIRGEDFGKLLKRKVTFTIQQVLGWADALLDGLAHLHGQSNPIIHRDIKPSNIILTKEDKVFLMDFGLAKGEPDSMMLWSETRARTASMIAFTMPYAPLEQLNGADTGVESDIFALGSTIYHMLTGQPPCKTAADRWSACGKSRRDPLPPAHELNPAISLRLSQVLSTAMAINPGERYASAAEMRAELAIVRAEITKPGEEMEEIIRNLENKIIPAARESAHAEKSSEGRSSSHGAAQNQGFLTFQPVGDEEKLRTRKETRQMQEEEVLQRAVEAEDEEEEETRLHDEKEVRPLAQSIHVEMPVASIAERRAKGRLRVLIMRRSIAALLVSAIALSLIVILRQERKLTPVRNINGRNDQLSRVEPINTPDNIKRPQVNPSPPRERPTVIVSPTSTLPQPAKVVPEPTLDQDELLANLINYEAFRGNHRDRTGAKPHYTKGIELYSSGEYRKAADKFEKAAKLNANLHQALINGGNSEAKLGNFLKAFELYGKANDAYFKVYKRVLHEAIYNQGIVSMLKEKNKTAARKAAMEHYQRLLNLKSDLAAELLERINTAFPNKRMPQRATKPRKMAEPNANVRKSEQRSNRVARGGGKDRRAQPARYR